MTKTIELSEENAEVNLCDVESGDDLLAMTPKAQAIKRD